jgi:acyl-CoA reductase-like NAD-dependent aldehyde dehydrogenase
VGCAKYIMMAVFYKIKEEKLIMSIKLDHWISGKAVPPENSCYFEKLRPIDDAVYAVVADGSPADVDAAVAAAEKAFSQTRMTLAKEREKWLFRAADLLEQRADEVREILVDEVGSPLNKAEFELNYAVGFLRAAAGVPRRMRGETLPSDVPGRFSMSLREPVGVVAGISPFNVPLIKGIKQSAMALATGNTFVLLPSEDAPRIALVIAKLWSDAGVPDGAFNVVLGNGAKIGDSLISHPAIRAITFTGSSRVGRHVAELAARNLKKVTLELGGKSPLVVFRDADIDKAVEAAAFGIFIYQGQVCMGSSRIFVEADCFDDFVKKLSEKAKLLRIGDLRDPSTMLGPIISPRQRERVRSHIEDAQAKGAKLVAGGAWNGNACAATVFTGVKPDMAMFFQETFGPVTAVYPFTNINEAIGAANNTEYGLSASVFTSNLETAMKMIGAVRSGMIHVNAPTLHDEPHVPFGGIGESGLGREGTEADLDLMTEWKWATIQMNCGGAH